VLCLDVFLYNVHVSAPRCSPDVVRDSIYVQTCCALYLSDLMVWQRVVNSKLGQVNPGIPGQRGLPATTRST